jgi:hypothetical protein
MKISLKYLGFSSFLSPVLYNIIMSMFLFILVSIKTISLTCIKATRKSPEQIKAWITAFLAKKDVTTISSTMLAVIVLVCGLQELKRVDPDWDVMKAVKMMKKLTHKQFLAYSWLECIYLNIAMFHIHSHSAAY